MWVLSLVVCAALSSRWARAEDLTAEQVRGLMKEPEDRKNIRKELLVYPRAKEYSVSMRSGEPGKERNQIPPVVAYEKVVRGKYLVSWARPEGAEEDLIMVVFFDQAGECYRKFVLIPKGIAPEENRLHRMIGTRVGQERVISWANESKGANGDSTGVTQEVHTDEKTTWKTVLQVDGKVEFVEEGVATVTKKAE